MASLQTQPVCFLECALLRFSSISNCSSALWMGDFLTPWFKGLEGRGSPSDPDTITITAPETIASSSVVEHETTDAVEVITKPNHRIDRNRTSFCYRHWCQVRSELSVDFVSHCFCVCFRSPQQVHWRRGDRVIIIIIWLSVRWQMMWTDSWLTVALFGQTADWLFHRSDNFSKKWLDWQFSKCVYVAAKNCWTIFSL